MIKIIKTIIIIFFSLNLYAQEAPNNYNLIKEISTPNKVRTQGGKSTALSSHFFISKDEKYLILQYGYKPAFVSIYEFNTFRHINTYKVSPWLYNIYSDNHILFAVGDNAFRKEIIYKIDLRTDYITTSNLNKNSEKCEKYKTQAFSMDEQYYFLSRLSGLSQFDIYKKQDKAIQENENPAFVKINNESASNNIRIRVSGKGISILKVAVIGKESNLCNGSIDDGQGLAELVEGELLGIYGVVERKHLEEIIDEQRLAMSGLLLEDSDFAQAGCLAGAQGTVLASYGCLQGETKIQVKLVDCSTSDLYWSATGIDVSAFEVLDALRAKLSE